MGVPAKDTRFLRKLYLILTTEDETIVGWTAEGRAFTIHDTALFQRMIKTKHHLSSLCTFRQNLHAHGFTEIEHPPALPSSSSLLANEARDEKTTKTGDSKADVKTADTYSIPETYFHPFFERGYPEHLEKISFDPSVKFRCQECKRQPNETGAKCTFRRNTSKAIKPEAAYAILAGITGASDPASGGVTNNRLSLDSAVGRSPLMVQVGGRRRHQIESSDADDTKPSRKLKHPPSMQLNLASSGGAFLRPAASSLSSEQHNNGQRAAGASGYVDSRVAPGNSRADSKLAPGSLMVRLSLGRKDGKDGGARPTALGTASPDSAMSGSKGIKLSVTLTSKATPSANGSSSTQSSLSKSTVSQKVMTPTTASNPKAMMSLKRISPSLSEQDDASDEGGYEPATDDEGDAPTSESNQVKRAAFSKATSYSHSKMVYPAAPNRPLVFPSNSTTELGRADHVAATSSQHLSRARDDSERGQARDAQSLLVDSDSVSYEQAANWSRHTISASQSEIRRGESQRSVNAESQRGNAGVRRFDVSSDFGLTDTSSSVSRDYHENHPSQPHSEHSSQFSNCSFEPTRHQIVEREQHEQPGGRRETTKPAGPPMVVIPTRYSTGSSPAPSQLSSSSVTAKPLVAFALMPTLKPPMKVTLSIGGEEKQTGKSSISLRSDSQSEWDAQQQQQTWTRATLAAPTIRRSTHGDDVAPTSRSMGNTLSWGVNASSGSASGVDSGDVPARGLTSGTPHSAQVNQPQENQSFAKPQNPSQHPAKKSTDKSAEEKTADLETTSKKHKRSVKRAATSSPSSSGAMTKKPRAQGARGNSSRAKSITKVGRVDGSTDHALSLLELASSEQS